MSHGLQLWTFTALDSIRGLNRAFQSNGSVPMKEVAVLDLA